MLLWTLISYRICCCSQCIVWATIVGFSGSRALLSSTKGARESLEGNADYVLTDDVRLQVSFMECILFSCFIVLYSIDFSDVNGCSDVNGWLHCSLYLSFMLNQTMLCYSFILMPRYFKVSISSNLPNLMAKINLFNLDQLLSSTNDIDILVMWSLIIVLR